MPGFDRQIQRALGAPFPDDEVEFLPRGQHNGRARAVAYINARSVMRRLDAAVGPENWHFDFDLLTPDGKMVRGRLTVLGVTKCDAGESDAESEALKSAVSDALKRCAVHFGIGRYLYYVPAVWTPYDAARRQFSETPRIPAEALRHALSICGLEPDAGAARPADERPTTRSRVAEDRSGSIWVSPAPAETSAPESSGDSAALRRADSGVPDVTCTGQGCRRRLTAAQKDLSLHVFGEVLCPVCQKGRNRNGARAH